MPMASPQTLRRRTGHADQITIRTSSRPLLRRVVGILLAVVHSRHGAKVVRSCSVLLLARKLLLGRCGRHRPRVIINLLAMVPSRSGVKVISLRRFCPFGRKILRLRGGRRRTHVIHIFLAVVPSFDLGVLRRRRRRCCRWLCGFRFVCGQRRHGRDRHNAECCRGKTECSCRHLRSLWCSLEFVCLGPTRMHWPGRVQIGHANIRSVRCHAVD